MRTSRIKTLAEKLASASKLASVGLGRQCYLVVPMLFRWPITL